MTSIAEPATARGWLRLRTVAQFALLLLLAWSTPAPWGALWLLVPPAVAAALLISWRWGAWGVLVPIGLLVISMIWVGPYVPWAWWLPVTALTGAWMGLREEGGGPSSGERAWTLLPVALMAAALPWALAYPELVAAVEDQMRTGDAQLLEVSRQIGYGPTRIEAMRRSLEQGAELQARVLPNVLPSALFAWMALLVSAGRGLAARLSAISRWPELSRGRLSDWRLPDAAMGVFLLGMGLLVAGWEAWAPTGWTLLIIAGLGYCVQGIAVVRSLLVVRGVPPSIVALTLLFVLIMATPVFLLSALCVGISDVWLDFRRLEATADDEL